MIHSHVLILALFGSILSNDKQPNYANMAHAHFNTNVDSALYYLDQAKAQSVETQNIVQLGWIYHSEGYLLDLQDKEAQSIKALQGAVKVYRDLEDHAMQVNMHEMIGSTALKVDLPSLAAIEYQRALDVNKNKKREAELHFDMGLARRDEAFYDEAIGYFLKSQVYYRAYGEKEKNHQLSRIFNEIGIVYKRIYEADEEKLSKWLDSAQINYERALYFAESTIVKTHATTNLGLIYIYMNEMDKAGEVLASSRVYSEKLPVAVRIPTLHNSGIYSYYAGEYEDAERIFNQVIEQATNLTLNDLIFEVDFELKRDYFDEMVEAVQYLDSMGLITKDQMSAFTGLMYKRIKKQKKIENEILSYSLDNYLSEADNALATIYADRRRDQWLFVAGILIIIGIIAFKVRRYNARKRKVEKALSNLDSFFVK